MAQTKERIFQQRFGDHYLTCDKVWLTHKSGTRSEYRVDGKLVSQATWLRYKRPDLTPADIEARRADAPRPA